MFITHLTEPCSDLGRSKGVSGGIGIGNKIIDDVSRGVCFDCWDSEYLLRDYLVGQGDVIESWE